MGDANEFVLLTERYEGLPVLSLIAPVALRRDAAMLTSSSKKVRLSALLPRLGMNLKLRLAHHLCGIMIPHPCTNR